MTATMEETLEIERIEVDGFEKVLRIRDRSVGLDSIICIHNTTLGPALGGTRIYPYKTFEEALTDAKRLASGMTSKSALAETGLGGGKSVIISDQKNKTPELLRSYGRAIASLKGEYICAEDVGSTPADMDIIAEVNPYVVGLIGEKSSGNPSPYTAFGTFRGIQSAIKHLDGTDELEGKTVAVQGLGSVGEKLCEMLFWAGAKLLVNDINPDRTIEVAKHYGAEALSGDEILAAECDVFAPCALGGVINPKSAQTLRCRAVAGCANNQLLSDSDAKTLANRGILYAPDFVINSGGLINVTCEILPDGYNSKVSRDKIYNIYDQLLAIYTLADKSHISTQEAANSLVDYRLEYGIGKKKDKYILHHAGSVEV